MKLKLIVDGQEIHNIMSIEVVGEEVRVVTTSIKWYKLNNGFSCSCWSLYPHSTTLCGDSEHSPPKCNVEKEITQPSGINIVQEPPR